MDSWHGPFSDFWLLRSPVALDLCVLEIETRICTHILLLALVFHTHVSLRFLCDRHLVVNSVLLIHIYLRLCDMNVCDWFMLCLFYICFRGLYSHFAVGVNLDWIFQVSSWKKKKVWTYYPTCSILIQSNYIDGRSSTALFFIVHTSWYQYFVMALTNASKEVGHHSLVSEPNFGTMIMS